MSQKHVFVYRMVIVMLTVILVITLVQSPRATLAASQASGVPMLAGAVFNIPCTSTQNVTQDYALLTGLASFSVHSSDSTLELSYNGRIAINSFSTYAGGAVFELRVDNLPSTVGRARASVKRGEVGMIGVPVSITGFFSGLSAGDHIASMWVRSVDGTASGAVLDTGCWGTDVLIVKEYLPFGVAYMPMISK